MAYEAAAIVTDEPRTKRLTTLVTESEGNIIERLAQTAGLSVSAYLREKALGRMGDGDEDYALAEIDRLIEKIEADLDGAIATVNAVVARLDFAPAPLDKA
jgi:hypothetical protein